MRRIATALLFTAFCIAGFGQTKTSASLTQVVNAKAAVPAVVTIKSSLNPATVGTAITYSGTVTCAGSAGAGTMTVVGLTGTQTVSLSSTGTYTCSETPTVATPGSPITATFNSSNSAACY